MFFVVLGGGGRLLLLLLLLFFFSRSFFVGSRTLFVQITYTSSGRAAARRGYYRSAVCAAFLLAKPGEGIEGDLFFARGIVLLFSVPFRSRDQVSYHKNIAGETEGNFATLRQPDAVGVLEAESNPSNGHYVGYWDTVGDFLF